MRDQGGKVDLELDALDRGLLTEAPEVVQGCHQDQLRVLDIGKAIEHKNNTRDNLHIVLIS